MARKQTLADANPKIAELWHPTKNGNLTAQDVAPFSRKKVWWVCPKGHESLQAIYSRTAGVGCPKCSRKKQLDSFRRNRVKKKGSIAETHPHLLAEWHPTKNRNISPTQISFGSHESIWWVCRHGHEWPAELKSRAKGHGCPYCSPQTSHLEIRLLCELRSIFPMALWRKRFTPYECDVFLPSLAIGVEVDGLFWHKDRLEEDIDKNQFLAANGVKIIRVRGTGLTRVGEHDIFYEEKESPLAVICRLLHSLLPLLSDRDTRTKVEAYLVARHYTNEKEYKKILSVLPSPPPERALKVVCPDLLKEWHPRNHPLTPAMFTAYTQKKMWWICPKGHEYISSISHRSNGRGCPICARESLLNAVTHKAIERSGSLADHYLISQFHPTKNRTIDPNSIPTGSGKMLWWKCEYGHEWEASVVNRTKRDSGCPYCMGLLPTDKTSLLSVNPSLALQWHSKKNGQLRPADVLPYSNKKVWWLCSKGHEWEAPVSSRSDGKGCPYCAGKKVNEENCLQTVNPTLAKEWHRTKNGSLTPMNVTIFSHKKVWWLCSKGHEWEAPVSNRSNGRGCPYCWRNRREEL